MRRENAINPYAHAGMALDRSHTTGDHPVPPQSVKYEATLDTLAALSSYLINKSGYVRKQMTYIAVLYPLVIGAVAVVTYRRSVDRGEPFSPLPTIAIAVLFGAVFLWTWWQRTGSRMKASLAARIQRMEPAARQAELGERELSIDDKGVRVIASGSESRTSWGGVQKVAHDEDHIYFLFFAAPSQSVPRTAFSSEHSYQGFANLAKQLHQEHGPKPAAQ